MALFNAYKEKFESAEIPAVRSRYLSALGSFRDPKIQDEGLTYALSGALRPQELFALGQGMGGSGDAGRDKLFNWMTENYDAIMAKVPPMFASFMPFFASGCSAERLAAAEAFFGTPERANPGTEKQLAKVAEGVDQCVGLREREGAAVANYLRRGESSPE